MQHITTLPSAPARPTDGHKGTFGRVLIIGGSRGMSGAPSLAGVGTLRGGAGLVYVAVPHEILPIVASIEPSYLTIPLATHAETGTLSVAALPALKQACDGKEAIAIGPGLGLTRDIILIVTALYREIALPMVIDADALNALATQPEALKQSAGPRVLTPHLGEFARLLGLDIARVQFQREKLAAEFAKTYGVIVLLKGPRTVITDGERMAINLTGNSGMATGGTGDVLTGLIAALLGQGMPPFEAAQLGAHLHGLAGDLAVTELSQPGLIASDLPKYLGRAWKHLLH
ncbi:MAG: NAD(P)H-hydrate dehydratase [Planctomycetia bacterium]|nr:NAD(P)H-hydrate dehydratase [Planctomycetia bacterium]